jgi:hypothetical protein
MVMARMDPPLPSFANQSLLESLVVPPLTSGHDESGGSDNCSLPKIASVAPVSCLNAPPSISRFAEPEGPFRWAVRWKYAPGSVGAHLLHEPVFCPLKAGWLDSRMIVSRKRTTNVFDLASQWRKNPTDSSSLVQEPLTGLEVVDDWSNNV